MVSGPRTKELADWLVGAMLKQAGLTKHEFNAFLTIKS
jgi:hypothetical protein